MSVLLLLIGLSMAGGGAYLAVLGGSPYYLLAGAGLVLTGILLWRGHGAAVRVYAATLFLTVGWSLWEAGLDYWALVPRLGLFLVIGLLLTLTCAIEGGWRSFSARSTGLLGAMLIAAAVLGALTHAWTGQAVADPAFARGMAIAGMATPYAPATARGGDWLNYGNDAGGSRFSPLTQITGANVDKLQVQAT